VNEMLFFVIFFVGVYFLGKVLYQEESHNPIQQELIKEDE
tara:strand:+ start:2079 stop:2198 length:120 start_codon:yes stop_codon:yes gene_type:complete